MKRIFISALLALPLGASAQTITFDTEEKDYQAVGVYDTWEASPFRTGLLTGNTAVVTNPAPSTNNETANVLAVQRSRFGSNTFGARIDLPQTFELGKEVQYVHVLIHKPTEGRVMLIGLGKRRERAGQSSETEQFWALSRTKVKAGDWADAVFAIKGAGGIDIYSLVVVPDCESPHDLTADYMCYIDEVQFTENAISRTASEDYPVNIEEGATYNRTERCLQKISLGTTTLDVARMASTDNPVYTDLMPQSFHVKAGETLTPRFTYTSTWMHGYVYVDFGNDGRFSVALNDNGTPAEGSDVVAYSYYKNKNSAGSNVSNENVLQPPSFTLPADMPTGFYRMRYKVDWNEIDAGGNVSESNHIINNGGAIVDVRLNVHNDMVSVYNANRNGEVLAEDGTKLSSYQTPFGQPFTIRMNPERGFTYDGILLRHGYNLAGDSLVHGTPQYVDTFFPRSSFTDDVFTIPAEYVDGDMEIEGLFVEDGSQKPDDPEPEYQLVFNDEFDQPDGSQPDPEKWSSSARRNAVWNRFVADDDRVVFIEDGALVCRAIRNPDRSTDDVAMLTGARETQGKFSFTYGKVEVRLKTLHHRGNFPAAWMMPEPPAAGWPNGGEIDIFETIDAQDRAWHTVHSNWTHNLGYKNNPASTFNEPCTVEDWHVYGLEWTEDEIKWTVDGEQVGYYFKAPGQSALDQGQWPFDHPFYIILNQSVGNGSWAAMYDEDFTYETRFDYVRVYQKQGIDGIQGVQIAQPHDNTIYDLQGRRVSDPQHGGIYIRNGKKFIM